MTKNRERPRRFFDDMRLYGRAELKDFLGSILDSIELDLDAATLQLFTVPLQSGVAWRPQGD